MGFSDPETITLPTAGAQALARTGYPNPRAAEWTAADDAYTLYVSHDRKKRDRSVASFTKLALVQDPLVPANYKEAYMRVQLIIDRSPFGFTSAQEIDVLAGFLAWATATSNTKALLLQGHAI